MSTSSTFSFNDFEEGFPVTETFEKPSNRERWGREKEKERERKERKRVCWNLIWQVVVDAGSFSERVHWSIAAVELQCILQLSIAIAWRQRVAHAVNGTISFIELLWRLCEARRSIYISCLTWAFRCEITFFIFIIWNDGYFVVSKLLMNCRKIIDFDELTGNRIFISLWSEGGV